MFPYKGEAWMANKKMFMTMMVGEIQSWSEEVYERVVVDIS